ncbi:predicted protein [Sclerotinia sclerotiorum 1980 UF-70]|uniref:Uncharacterized protein n=1 Tax=Sclerotinia sclerotiorum (strain ATCC 18683 / 1980 / Ss-1) TaxID=665079 RepID=A7EVJ0_SCLS1|nr:predicted protein [Sclerotinia sclerotiorum 1980 UF-70]EDN93482.1 predicted protein [Sclerotinia sclerotiorum 1980 UF-70]
MHIPRNKKASSLDRIQLDIQDLRNPWVLRLPYPSRTNTRETTLKRVKFSPPSYLHYEERELNDGDHPIELPRSDLRHSMPSNTLSSDDPFKSPINRPMFQFNKKRRRQPSHLEPHINSPKEAIQKARSLLILAASLEEDTEEQSKVLDLIEIFCEYLEKGKLIKASNIITL